MRKIFFSIVIFFSFPVFAFHYGNALCKQEGFFCLTIKKGQTWEKLFPDERERSIEMRVNRMNTQIYPGLVIAIPHQLETADIMDFSPFSMQVENHSEKLIIVDPYEKAWGAYDESGELIRWGPLSAGTQRCMVNDITKNCRTTPGSYRIFSLGSSGCISHKYPEPEGGAPMPYCMFFNNGQALHGSPNGVVGYNASHGCVRLYVNDAEWLRFDFVEGPNSANGYRGTKIIVKAYE